MKKTDLLFPALLTALAMGLVSCDKHDHDHDGHDHDGHDHDSAESAGHDDDDDHSHGEDSDHVHEKGEPGPNGGRLITSVEPHFEILVTDERKVQLTFLEEDNKTTIAPAGQVVSMIAGDRSSPTALAFTKSGNVLVSDKTLPEGDDFPAVVQIQLKPDAEMNREKFNLDLSDCPTCDHKEYACICDHGDHDH